MTETHPAATGRRLRRLKPPVTPPAVAAMQQWTVLPDAAAFRVETGRNAQYRSAIVIRTEGGRDDAHDHYAQDAPLLRLGP